MSCNHCSTKFNFFHKEAGCANCGLSFCGKCLKQKCKIPSKGAGEFHVCRICYSKLSQGSIVETQFEPPDRLLKRLENMENPAAPPITMYKHDTKMKALKPGLSYADQQLVDRLERLKEHKPLPPTDSEIRERLANLKGENANIGSGNTNTLFMPDTRSDQEKIDSLLDQLTGEQNIEISHGSHEDIAVRLAKLKGQEYKPNNFDPNSIKEYDSEDEIQEITKKIKAEVALDSQGIINYSENNEELRPSSPELPWCVLCNNDATFRCLDCSGDLYCSSCNVEVHKTWGDTDHRVVPYKPK